MTMDPPTRVALVFGLAFTLGALAFPPCAVPAVIIGALLIVRGHKQEGLFLAAAALAMAVVAWNANGPSGVLKEKTNCAELAPDPGLQRDLCETGAYD